jgi:hypothetical protein
VGLLDPVERMIQQSKCRPLEMDAILVLNGFTERSENPFLENGQKPNLFYIRQRYKKLPALGETFIMSIICRNKVVADVCPLGDVAYDGALPLPSPEM